MCGKLPIINAPQKNKNGKAEACSRRLPVAPNLLKNNDFSEKQQKLSATR